ncbi:ATP-binding protein [Elioraea sp.]|uniref:ATP-binding protein n=1 Tax=Elioraea sp. TaxID=2185103 RepID=UPI0025B8516D|nr:ATP-binding protein [Elioraea sp.]
MPSARRFRTASFAAALLLLGVALSAVAAVMDWQERHEAAFSHPYDNAQWLVFQGAYETFRLHDALDAHEAAANADDIILRHEIFQSRVIALQNSAVGKLLASDAEAAALLSGIAARAALIDGRVQPGDLADPALREALAAELAGVIALFNRTAMRAIHIAAYMRTRDLVALRTSQTMVSDIFLVAAASALGLFAIVTVQLRRIDEERARAEAASKTKSAFLATMSHELRTPLNGVIGTLDLLADDAMPQASRARVAIARRSADLLLAIIGDVLDMAKLEEGRVTIDRVVFPLARVVEEVRETFAAIAAIRGVGLSVNLAPEADAWFKGDPVRLRQILSNLVSNALKFTEAGSVTVTAQVTDAGDAARLTLSVADTGIGIPAAALARLGRRFEQADATIARRYGGTGLGLAIVRALAEAMGGGLAIASTEGKGSEITVTCLLVRAEAPAQREPPLPAVPAGILVLLAEDNAVNQITATAMIERFGARVDVAVNGAEAVRRAATQCYDMILMDMQMPELDGIEATRAIRAGHSASARSPIVALTASAFTEDVERCRAAGMDGYLTKPLRKRALAEVLATVAPPRAGRDAA